jgi:glutamate/tyrosine decarboxylase-like PLP-dependent enzyme
MSPNGVPDEETLDPRDWGAFRALAHRMLDDMLDHLSTLREQPVWQSPPEATRALLRSALPLEGQGEESVYREFVEHVLPYTNGNRHPRFWGWVQGNGTPLGMLADMLASGMNPHMAGFDQAPRMVEEQVLAWLAEMLGFPSGTSGVLVEGGSMANVLALAVARHARAGFDVRAEGLQGGHAPLVAYGSSETHSWARKAVELLGLGDAALHRVPIDAGDRMDTRELVRAIAADRAAGRRPFCVIASAGTVNTGATDDLVEIGRVCRDEGLWLHVDGAFGALAYVSERLRPLVHGLEQADSLAFDLHKWGYLPFGVACLLVRDAEAHRAAFALTASYLTPGARGVIAGGLPFADRGLDLTRGFRALKVWFALKAHGVATLARLVEQNVEQARHLARLVEGHADLQLLAPVALNIVCFRYVAPGLDDAVLDALNEELLLRVQESGLAVPSSTVVRGRYALRVAVTNHRSRRADFDLLVAAVRRHGAELLAERAR